MALRINAIGAGAVEYLLRGSGCDRDKERAVDLDAVEGMAGDRQKERSAEADPGLEQGHAHGGDYLQSAVERGEPAGVWLGEGMAGLGLSARDGDVAVDTDVRAIFGQLRRPESTEAAPAFIGSKPRTYPSTKERLAKLLAAEPDGTAKGERLAELERQAAGSGRQAVAYYDFTFSPVKSVSVLYAALLAAGDVDGAQDVRAAHDTAVRDAMAYAEHHIAWTRVGDHGRNADGDRVGAFVEGTGLSAVAFSHSTSRESEPQLHTHVGVLNRVASIDEHGDLRITALDGRGFGPIKELLEAGYTRALEDQLTEARGVVFATRPDGKAREIVGVDTGLMAEASTRTSQVLAHVEGLVERFRAEHGREPDTATLSRMTRSAVLATRRAKSELTGPAAVAQWAEPRRDRLVAMLDDVDMAGLAAATRRAAGDGPVAGEHGPVANAPELAAGGPEVAATGQSPVAGDRVAGEQVAAERVAAAVAAGVQDVQAAYATWTLGNLAAAIDRHLPETRALGIGRTERPGYVEGLARAAVAPDGGRGVVQLTGHEPVEVPAVLLRASDGRPRFRPHMDQRYATSSHLAREDAVLARAAAAADPVLGDDAAVAQVRARLEVDGLSRDQVDAVLGVLTARTAGVVLVGPAGTGKSRTVTALAREWAAATRATPDPGSGTGAGIAGRVFGVATSEIATRVLRHDGLVALNTTRFLDTYGHPPHGGAQGPRDGARGDGLRPGDLVVVDEAGMASTDHLERITAAAAAAGARVLVTGDPEQLGAVGAGGLFTLLAERAPAGTRHDLDQVHRLTHGWERAASVRLRAGDASVFDEYHARGRIEAGTWEHMAQVATRHYVTDRLAGRSAVLVVGTNAAAAQLGEQVREQLVAAGVVSPVTLAVTRDGLDVGIGDVVAARQNDYGLRVDPAPSGRADPVTNRSLYTVIGRGPGGDVFARDEHGAVAHLPEDYVGEHVTHAYAATVHAAQGLTVTAAYELADEATTREAHYVAATRGTERNMTLLVSERDPDEHDPAGMTELARERFTGILARRGADPAATAVAEQWAAETGGVAAPAARIEVVTGWAARERDDAVLDRLVADGALDSGVLARLRGEYERPDCDRLHRALREAELAGHDPAQVLADVVAGRELHTADSVGDVLRHRVRHAAAARTPERAPATSWADIVAPHRDAPEPAATATHEAGTGVDATAAAVAAVESAPGSAAVESRAAYLAELADLGDTRRAALGAAAAAETAPWALAALGEVPDRDLEPAARVEWERRAAVIAGAREFLGVDPEQTSLGQAPARERVLAHQQWRAAAAEYTEPGDPSVRDWARADDHDLYAARETWRRTLDTAPPWVGDELAAGHRLVREYDAEAVRATVRAQRAEPGTAAALDAGAEADRWAAFAAHHRDGLADLEIAHQTRQAWWDQHTPERAADHAAGVELDRRALPLERGTTDPAPAAAPETDAAPSTDTTASTNVDAAAVPARHDDLALDLDVPDAAQWARREVEPTEHRRDHVVAPAADDLQPAPAGDVDLDAQLRDARHEATRAQAHRQAAAERAADLEANHGSDGTLDTRLGAELDVALDTDIGAGAEARDAPELALDPQLTVERDEVLEPDPLEVARGDQQQDRGVQHDLDRAQEQGLDLDDGLEP